MPTALDYLNKAKDELTGITRGKDFAFWQQETEQTLTRDLSGLPPFDQFGQIWIFTGDGGGMLATPRIGKWVINHLLARRSAEEILAAFKEEVARNVGSYAEISPLIGVQLDKSLDLGGGVTLEAAPEDQLAALLHYVPYQGLGIPVQTSRLRQQFTVTPAFMADLSVPANERLSKTEPAADERRALRERLRLACLLASEGPVEIPVSVLESDRLSLLVGGEASFSGRTFTGFPRAALPVSSAAVAGALDKLRTFKEPDTISRAIDRLGRSRASANDVDRALDLGMAAEIILMHDHGTSNTEIAHKISGRAAWLLGTDVAERNEIFSAMKKLYGARSQAVHTGKLATRSPVDLASSDRIVTRVLNAILQKGAFPNWSDLTMGGG